MAGVEGGRVADPPGTPADPVGKLDAATLLAGGVAGTPLANGVIDGLVDEGPGVAV